MIEARDAEMITKKIQEIVGKDGHLSEEKSYKGGKLDLVSLKISFKINGNGLTKENKSV